MDLLIRVWRKKGQMSKHTQPTKPSKAIDKSPKDKMIRRGDEQKKGVSK
jgi:hypothetical protein